MSISGKPATKILVTGASSQIGDFLLPRLRDAGYAVRAVSRVGQPSSAGVEWHRADLEDRGALETAGRGCASLIHLAPVWTLPPHLEDLQRAGVRRVVAFSSTSRFGKQGSRDPGERRVVQRLEKAEESLAGDSDRLGLCWTVLRPTLIYGRGRDRNVTSISRVVRRFGVFPVAGAARGLRQPVHADDLAQAACAVLETESTCGRGYNLGGGETLSYRDMVVRVFLSLGRKPRIITVPAAPLRGLLRVLRTLPRFRYVGPDMADRMNRDLVYDLADAERDIGYAPRRFQP